jgi:hypothetical protein
MTNRAVEAKADDEHSAVPQEAPKSNPKAAVNRLTFTAAQLDELVKARAHRQETFWDDKETGLCVLRSRGPKNKKQSTLTFRVVYYLPSKPGMPRYKAIGRYPVKYPKTDKDPGIDCSDIKAVRDRARQIRIDAKKGIDPKRPQLSGNIKELVERFVEEHSRKKNQCWRETKRIFDRYVVPECRTETSRK